METIFDYNPTEKEFKNLFFSKPNKKRYLEINDQISSNQDLAKLFYYRGDMERAKYYASTLSFELQESFWRTVTHP